MARTTQIFAHRGAKLVAPENTLPAFERALAMGVDGIELDVQCSKDGVPVVMHNFTVDETTDGTGRVADLTSAELRRLDAGRHFSGDFLGTHVPTLEDVLALVGTRCRLNIEIKSADPLGGSEVELIAQMIRAGDLYDTVIVSSFNPITLIKMHWYDARIPLGLLYHGAQLPQFLREAWLSPIMHPQAFHPHHSLVDAEYMAWAKGMSLAVNTWTVNDVDEARRLVGLGVDAIISDAPDALIAALD